MVFNGLDAAQVEFGFGHGHARFDLFAISIANPYGNSPSKLGAHGTNTRKSIRIQQPSLHGLA
jgi:hypothetical protein